MVEHLHISQRHLSLFRGNAMSLVERSCSLVVAPERSAPLLRVSQAAVPVVLWAYVLQVESIEGRGTRKTGKRLHRVRRAGILVMVGIAILL